MVSERISVEQIRQLINGFFDGSSQQQQAGRNAGNLRLDASVPADVLSLQMKEKLKTGELYQMFAE
eukprot:3513934-Rhodomonas_salina.1